MQILPYKIQFVIFLILFGLLIINACKGGSARKDENNQNAEQVNDNNQNIQLLKNNSSLTRIIFYEIFYFLYNSFDSYLKFYKVTYLNNYRFEDYCSIHDYHVIIKALLIFFFVGLNKSDCGEWFSAFKDYDLESEDKEAQDLVDQIHNFKLEKVNKNTK